MQQEKKSHDNIEKVDNIVSHAKSKVKFKLDTAGKFFTFSASKKIPCVYRIWAVMKNYINIEQLQQALNNVLLRFPYFHVKLTKGFFWYKWRKVEEKPLVEMEPDFPCKFISLRDRHTFPYRIIANQNQIIIEFFHGLTDGIGALQFMRSLICEYLALEGFFVKDWGDIFRPREQIDPLETEYSYRANFKLGIPKLPKIYRAFHLPFIRAEPGVTYVTNGNLDVSEVLAVSKKWKVTLTEFLTAVYIDALQDIMFELPNKKFRKKCKPIRIMMPINARNIISSKTMRNFTTFIAPGIDPRLGKFTFEEIINQVHHFKNLQINEKYMIQQISYFVSLEVNPLISTAPYFVKLWLMKPLYRKLGEALFSAFLTNLGKTTIPNELINEVETIQVLPMNHPYFKTGCGLLTYFNELNINFLRNIKEDIVEEKFFNKLKEFGLNVKVTRLF